MKPQIYTGQILSKVAMAMISQISNAFSNESTPEGEAWAPNKSGKTPVGTNTGKLRSSFYTQKSSKTTAVVKSSAIYASLFKRRFVPNNVQTAVAEALNG
jgi:phage gpG-like protein